MRWVIVAAVLIAGCTPRPDYALVPDAAAIGDERTIYFGTTRTPDPMTGPGVKRAEDLTLGRVRVSIPPQHTPGRLEVRTSDPDPQQHFALTGQDTLSRSDFRKTLRSELAKNGGEAVIFVHGFNMNFSEAMFRSAQVQHDFNLPSVHINYAWPSLGAPLGYAYDRDSALFARDGLEDLIKEVNAAGASSVLLVGHSMGGHLVMEAMRQIAIGDPQALHQMVDEVVLISPDLDVDVFRSQAQRIGNLPQPFVVFVSERDGALALSARLTGLKNRLGNTKDLDQIADLPVTMVDVTEFASIRDLGHFTVGSSPMLISMLSGSGTVEDLISEDRSGNTGLITGAVLTLQKATEIVLLPLPKAGG